MSRDGFKVTLRLPEDREDDVWRLARKHGIGHSVLLRRWIMEALDREVEAERQGQGGPETGAPDGTEKIPPPLPFPGRVRAVVFNPGQT